MLFLKSYLVVSPISQSLYDEYNFYHKLHGEFLIRPECEWAFRLSLFRKIKVLTVDAYANSDILFVILNKIRFKTESVSISLQKRTDKLQNTYIYHISTYLLLQGLT